jgi:hypothetical protein
MIQDWPQDIGENQVLVTLKICQHLCLSMFEMTVFFAAFNGYYFYMRSKLWPSNKLKILM